MSQHRSIRDAVWACPLSHTAKLVALRLVEHWPRIFPSVSSLAQWTGLSERSVHRALRELEQRGVIATGPRPGSSSAYVFVGVSIPDLGTSAIESGVTAPTPANEADPLCHVGRPTPARLADEADNLKQTSEADRIPAAPDDATSLHRERKPRPKTVSAFALPDDFKPGAACWQLATEQGVSVDEELPAFCDYHRAKRSRFVDWQAAFRTWIRNAAKFNRGAPKSGPRRRDAPNQPNCGLTGLEKAREIL